MKKNHSLIEIRPFKRADQTDLISIHDRARPIELAGSCDPRAFVPLADDKSDLAEFDAAKKFVALSNNGVIEGFIGIDKDTIGWLYVEPDQMGKGLGRMLLQYALTRLEGKSHVYVLDGNKAAINLYQSEGFNMVDKFKSKNNNYPCRVLKLAREGSTLLTEPK
ncbi:MAG: GNAT superfamily N-acetyltransferase [Candidatus Azotimanducaceae bacterium]|jgi:GNAT superfamily N-acetyltransferase